MIIITTIHTQRPTPPYVYQFYPGKPRATVPHLSRHSQDYLTRLQKTFVWAGAHAEDWSRVVAEKTQQPYDQAYKTFTDGYAQYPSKIALISPAAIAAEQDVADVFADAGVLDKHVQMKDVWDTSFNASLAPVVAVGN